MAMRWNYQRDKRRMAWWYLCRDPFRQVCTILQETEIIVLSIRRVGPGVCLIARMSDASIAADASGAAGRNAGTLGDSTGKQ